MARTPKTTEDRREQILDAALGVFANKGFDRASNKDIAREAGITTGLIYHYFASKGELLKSLLEERSPLYKIRQLYMEMESQPPEILLRSLANRVLDMVEEPKVQHIFRIFLPELLFNQTISSLGLKGIQEGTRFLETYLQKQMDLGVLRPTDASLAAQTFMGSVMGFILRRQLLHDPMALKYSREEVVNHLVASTLQGLYPR
jgi:AcrR family transcriptional regulator